jgi:RNA polymerase sigma factor (sigma-70 family)
MKQPDSQELLAEYVRNGSEQAFRELVTRYLDLVYSTALRSVDGDTHRAEDIAQTVFLDLARLASRLSKDIMLGGWLHRHTCYVASTFMRGERRRQARERQAIEMKALEDRGDSRLAHLGPLLDAAINELDDEDRKAILLRFYERLDLRSIGQALGSSENAAQKRVSRALDQLQSILTHRGVTLSVTALSAILAGEAITAPPAGLAAGIIGSSLAGAATGTGVSVTLFKLSTLTKVKLSFAAAFAVAGMATTLWLEHRSGLKLGEENQFLRQQLAHQAQVEPTVEVAPMFVENASPKRAPKRAAPVAEVGDAVAPQMARFAAGFNATPASATAPSVPAVLLLGAERGPTRFYAKSGSKMKLEGTSNVHDWQAESSLIGGFFEVGSDFPLEPGQSARQGKVEARAEPSIMVRSIKSVERDGRPYSDYMDQVMHEQLKADEFPKIFYSLTELTLKESAKKRDLPSLFEAKGKLTIAGVTNEIRMPIKIYLLDEKKLKISGNATIRMTDFEIDPPSPTLSFGMIKTENEVKLSFDWMVSQTNTVTSSARR